MTERASSRLAPVIPSTNFSHPWALALAILPALVLLIGRVLRFGRISAVHFSAYDWLPTIRRSGSYKRNIGSLLHLLAALSLVPIVAGMDTQKPIPQSRYNPSAWMIVLDVSSSMTAEDFHPQSRLEAAKISLKEFVSRNPGMELGLILFAGTSQLMVPLTPDHQALLAELDKVRPADYGEDGTAIGSGVASAVNRLREGKWADRGILLITDGVNNRGAITPLDAARLARTLSISIHAVGIGTDFLSRYWVPSPDGTPLELRARIEIDDKALQALSQETGGSYQRVKNSDELRRALLLQNPGPARPESAIVLSQDLRWVQGFAWLCLLCLSLEFLLVQFIFPELPG